MPTLYITKLFETEYRNETQYQKLGFVKRLGSGRLYRYQYSLIKFYFMLFLNIFFLFSKIEIYANMKKTPKRKFGSFNKRYSLKFPALGVMKAQVRKVWTLNSKRLFFFTYKLIFKKMHLSIEHDDSRQDIWRKMYARF